jgi:phytoene synthase
MQLTNIARDIGEDAKEGRLYVPHDWFQQEGLDPNEFLLDPNRSESTVVFTKRLLGKAETLYHRSEAGIAYLPPKLGLQCLLPGIFILLLELKLRKITMTILTIVPGLINLPKLNY